LNASPLGSAFQSSQTAADRAYGVEHPVDIVAPAAKVDDARAEHVPAAQLGAREKRLAAKL